MLCSYNLEVCLLVLYMYEFIVDVVTLPIQLTDTTLKLSSSRPPSVILYSGLIVLRLLRPKIADLIFRSFCSSSPIYCIHCSSGMQAMGETINVMIAVVDVTIVVTFTGVKGGRAAEEINMYALNYH